MVAFRAGPYTVEIPYIVDGLDHKLEFNCDTLGAAVPGSAPTAVMLRTRDTEGVNLDVGVNAAWAVIKPVMATGALASTYTLWKRNVNNDDKLFISAGSLSSPNGSGGAYVPASQAIMTLRAGGGNVLKITLMESVFTRKDRVSIDSSGVPGLVAVADYCLTMDSWIMARGQSFPVAKLNVSFGNNDKTEERRYRA